MFTNPDPPEQIAHLAADRGRIRSSLRRQRLNGTASPQNNPAVYLGYDADAEQHQIALGGRVVGTTPLTNAGQKGGERVNWQPGYFDAKPTRPIEQEEDPVLGGDEVVWAALVYSRKILKLLPLGDVQLGHEFWIWTQAGVAKVCQIDDLLDVPVPSPNFEEPDIAPVFSLNHVGWFSFDEDLKAHLDFKLGYPGPFKTVTIEGDDNQGGGATLEVQQLTTDWRSLHYQIQDLRVEQVSSSSAWRRRVTNSNVINGFAQPEAGTDGRPTPIITDPPASPCVAIWQESLPGFFGDELNPHGYRRVQIYERSSLFGQAGIAGDRLDFYLTPLPGGEGCSIDLGTVPVQSVSLPTFDPDWIGFKPTPVYSDIYTAYWKIMEVAAYVV